MKRGDLVTVAASGDYGKPRPALIIQSDAFEDLASVTILPLTSELHDAPLLRLTIDPDPANGLREQSQVMVDKAITIPRRRLGERIGALSEATLGEVGRALARFLALA